MSAIKKRIGEALDRGSQHILAGLPSDEFVAAKYRAMKERQARENKRAPPIVIAYDEKGRPIEA